MLTRALTLTAIAIMTFTSACGDSATRPPGIEAPVTYRLVVSAGRDPEEKAEVELERIGGVAVVAIRSPDGPIDLRVEDWAEPGFSITNMTGEEVLVSLFRDGHLASEDRVEEGRTLVFGNIS